MSHREPVPVTRKLKIMADPSLSKSLAPPRRCSPDRLQLHKMDDLFDAAMHGNLDVLRNELQKDPSRLNAKDQDGVTLLIQSLLAGQWEVAKYLIEIGADTTLTTNDGSSAYSLVGVGVSGQQEAIHEMRHLLRKTATIHEAAGHGHEDVLRHHLAADPDSANARVGRGCWTPLLHAAYHGQVAAVRILLAAGADVDAHDDDGCGAPFLNCNGYRGHDRAERFAAIEDMLMQPRKSIAGAPV